MNQQPSRARLPGILIFLAVLYSLLFKVTGQPSPFRAEVQTVEVPVTILDESGKRITGLRIEDLQLYEDGVLQKIRNLAIDYRKVNILLLLDLSRSVESQSKNIKRAAQSFVRRFEPQDMFAVIGFAHGMMPVQDWTTDKKRLLRVIGKLETGTQTQLYDAVQTAMENQVRSFEGRKACVLITDGIDTSSEATFQGVLKSVYRKEMAIYAINILKAVKGGMERYKRIAYVARLMERLGETNYLETFFRQKEEEMSQLALYSGGRAFFLEDLTDMQDICHQVALEIKSQYVLTYISENNPSTQNLRNIKLFYKPFPNYQCIYRRGYYLSRSASQR
jgi:Ca-activated chloride channel family protein